MHSQKRNEVLNRTVTLMAYKGAVEQVIHAMYNDIEGSLSLQDMADIACASPFHFNRVFHQITGLPPFKFRAVLRMREAIRLLISTKLSVTEICFEVGYSSLGTFTTDFTHYVGMSPRRLRVATGHNAPVDAWAGHQEVLPEDHTSRINGYVSVPQDFREGLIFLALFPQSMPGGQPLGCTRLSRAGYFEIGCEPAENTYLFAVAIRTGSESFDDGGAPLGAPAYVGSLATPLHIDRRSTHYQVDLTLRRPQLTDPPILFAMPLLMARRGG